MKAAISLFVVCVILFTSCHDRDKKGKLLDTPISGSLTIVADESLRPLIDAEIETFNAIYRDAHVSAIYLPEAEAIDRLMKGDSIRVAILTRHLSAEEKKYFNETLTIRPREEDLAYSGIALLVNKANPDTLISIAQIKAMLKGEIKQWNQIGGKSKDGIKIVFDNPNSGLIRQLKDSVAKVDKLPANCFAVDNNGAVVDYVSKNTDALGLIGLEWISDNDDSTTNVFLGKAKVVAVAGDSTHFQPYQAYIALKYYPLTRMITAVNVVGRTGLGAGFAAFFASERGQRIVLKAGLVPKTMPLRIIQVNPKGVDVQH
jgi:phosphate transport system substrate-binding protein